ncbi:MAG: trypsin-like peptidase domain-containing protein [Magnetococcales bacterium]|nr:trypsin-like peptidase domain-containing protein [Magnetococcales bacterium]
MISVHQVTPKTVMALGLVLSLLIVAVPPHLAQAAESPIYQAFLLASLKARQGNAKAQQILSKLIQSNQLSGSDRARAFKSLGRAYENGQTQLGIARDPKEAGYWYLQCSKLNQDAYCLKRLRVLALETGAISKESRAYKALLAAGQGRSRQVTPRQTIPNTDKAVTVSGKSGTGFFVSPYHIVTNNHVVTGKNNFRIKVPGKSVPVTLVAHDISLDLAVLKSPIAFPVHARIQSGRGPRAGEVVYTSGYAGSQYSVNIGRVVKNNVKVASSTGEIVKYIKFDAPLLSGSSGTALVDKTGHVVGVNTMGTLRANKKRYANKRPSSLAVTYLSLVSFLRNKGIPFSADDDRNFHLTEAEIRQNARNYTVFVFAY